MEIIENGASHRLCLFCMGLIDGKEFRGAE